MKISVILPNYNHSAFIARAIDGIRAQTHQDLELCLVDDGSTDDSWSIIQRYRERDPRIVAEKAPQNRGVNATLRRGFELSTGELLYPAAADDYLSNARFFELAVAALQRFPQAAIAYARAEIIDGDKGQQIGVMGSYIPSRRNHGEAKDDTAGAPTWFIRPQEALTQFVSHHMFIPGCSVILKRAGLTELGGYDDALGPQADYFLNHALAALHGAVFIDASVAVARVAATTYSGSASDEQHIRRVALVEKKLRALALPYETDERLFAQFRTAAIGSRFVEVFQRKLFDTVRASCESIPLDALQMFPPEPAAFIASLKEDCARLENTLDENIEKARRIFDEMAGPIAPHQPVPQAHPRPWLKPV
ncbi:MAG: glycosyltransferase family A protein, partial [Methylocystis sp.]